jgi:hypothetical protein
MHDLILVKGLRMPTRGSREGGLPSADVQRGAIVHRSHGGVLFASLQDLSCDGNLPRVFLFSKNKGFLPAGVLTLGNECAPCGNRARSTLSPDAAAPNAKLVGFLGKPQHEAPWPNPGSVLHLHTVVCPWSGDRSQFLLSTLRNPERIILKKL